MNLLPLMIGTSVKQSFCKQYVLKDGGSSLMEMPFS